MNQPIAKTRLLRVSNLSKEEIDIAIEQIKTLPVKDDKGYCIGKVKEVYLEAEYICVDVVFDSFDELARHLLQNPTHGYSLVSEQSA